jgi:hypothetical protein
MSGNGVFNNVSANGMNVTGILQASQIITTQPMQVSNVTVSGQIQSDLRVQGNVFATGYVSGQPNVDVQNLSARTVMDPAQVYNYTDQLSIVNGLFFVKPILATESIALRGTAGPTAVMTSNTAHNNPVATTAFGKAAPLIKIQDNGTYKYINVASNTITQICTEMLPTTANANTIALRFAINNPTTDLAFAVPTVGGQTVASYSNVVDTYTNIITTLAKRGLPIPPLNGCKTYNINNIYHQSTSVTDDYSFSVARPGLPAGIGPIQVAIDVNPYNAGTGTMNLHFCGGFAEVLPIALPGVNYEGHPSIPALTLPVTTSSVEYETKVSSGQNVLYLNRSLNILNISIVNFGSYSITMTDASNVFGSNVLTSSPQSFNGSFSFFRTSSKVTTTASGAEVPSASVSMSIVSGGAPVTSNALTADYLIQACEKIVFKYNLSNVTTTNSYTTTITTGYNGIADYWTLPKYDNGSGINAIQYFFNGDETTGMPHTNTSNVGKNDFYPFLNTNKGKSGQNFAALNSFVGYTYLDSDLNRDAEFVKNFQLPLVYPESLVNIVPNHEFQHMANYSIGLDQRDHNVKIFDDELVTSISSPGMITKNFMKKDAFTFYGLSTNAIAAHVVARGGSGIVNMVQYDHLSSAFSGTNFNVQALFNNSVTPPYTRSSPVFNVFFGKYANHNMFCTMASKYDPNYQLLKLMLFNQAKFHATIPTNILQAIQYQNGKVFYEMQTVNPALGLAGYKESVSNVQMYYSDSDGGALITNPGELWENEVITTVLGRKNAAIPDKYKNLYAPVWTASGYNSNVALGVISSSGIQSAAQRMFTWDYLQTNDDPIGANARFEQECVVPWWPKDITGLYTGNVNSVGRLYINPVTFNQQAQTQDTSYRAMANTALTTYTSNVVRILNQADSFMYALPVRSTALTGVSNVTVTLQEPTVGTYSGGYNSNISVSVFKYIPERCASNVLVGEPTSNTGAFMMSGPHFLSKTGTTSVTIDLTSNITDGSNGIFKTNSSNLANGTVSFSKVFQYGIDDGTVYIPPAYANARAVDLGMTTNSGVYQPVTYLLVNNRNIDDISWSDGDIQQKLWSSQVKPSCVKVSVNGAA